MKTILFTLFTFITCNSFAQKNYTFKTKFDDAVPVLNVGTFHMGFTSDATSTEFDEHNIDNIKQVHELAKQIAKFKPTIILVERVPYYNPQLATSYQNYLKDQNIKFQSPSEIELLAFEVGRLSGTKKIYGIDYHQDYFYQLPFVLKNQQDSLTFKRFDTMFNENQKENLIDEEKMSVKDLLWLNNQPDYLDAMINYNADLLTTVSVNGYPIGTEQASKFYNRNLMMFANMNNIPVTKNDRIFVLMGATHTAYFKDFLRRSPKFIEVNTLDYLK